MKTRILTCLSVLLLVFVLGCNNKSDAPKPRYQPQGDVNREQKYHWDEASRHLKEIKKVDRDSHWHIADFWRHVAAGGFEFDIDTFKVTTEKIDSLTIASFQVAAKFDLEDLRSLKFDGNHRQAVANVHKYAEESNLSLEDLGTTEEELQDLLINNVKSQARRILADLRLRRDKETLEQIDVYDYTSKIRELAEDIGVSLEIFGTNSTELQDFENIGTGE